MNTTVADRIAHLLNTFPDVAYTPLQTAHILKANPNTVRRTVRQMDLAGEVDRFGGLYIAFPKDLLVPAQTEATSV